MKPVEFMKQLQKDVGEKSLLKHPFYQLWNKGQLPKKALDEYADQYYHFMEHFPRFVAATYAKCMDVKERQFMLRNLVEEEIGDWNSFNPHAEQWNNFAKALGRKQAKKARLFPTTKKLLKTLETQSNKGFVEGVASAYAYETQVSEIAKTKKAGLQKWYGIHSKKGLEFFDTHMEADIHHSRVWRKILKKHAKTPSQQKRIRKALNASLDAQNGFLDGMMKFVTAA